MAPNRITSPLVLPRLAAGVAKVRSFVHEHRKSRARSPQWDSVRDAHLLAHPTCAACGGTFMLQVHHVVPFHVEACMELDPANLLTLCMGEFDCHLRLGHGGSFRCYNPYVRENAVDFLAGTTGVRLRLLREALRSRRRD